jgi:hypothetical protein
MSRLDWSRADYHTADPGRVTSVGDYGILSDRRAGRKGNPVREVVKRTAPKPKKTEKQIKREAARAAHKEQQAKRKAMKAVSPPRQSPEAVAKRLNQRMSGVEVYVRKRTGNIVRAQKKGN